jgi:transposase
MKKQAHFKPYEPNQLLLLPPDMRHWLAEDDLVYFVMDVVRELDLSDIYASYDGSQGGQPAYDPTMMTSLLLYAYCIGLPSSRKIEQATYTSVPFRVITADQHPDHDTIAEFRKRHLRTLAELFVQILQICRQAGLVKLGHVSLDGTKVRANASKHKAMSYGRMEKKAEELEAQVKRLLEEAQAADAAEDALYGKGRRGDELPEELRSKQSRLNKIREAMASLEAEAKEQAEAKRKAIKAKDEELEKEGKKRRGKKPKDPSGKPEKKAQRNFTDPESRIMKDGATKSFEQCYNCQAAVDEKSQIIVATHVTQQANDKQQLEPLVEEIKSNLDGAKPKKISADNGYYSETNVAYLEAEGIDGFIATNRQKHSDKPVAAPRGRIPKDITTQERMARKLRTKKGRETYSKRKHIVEPVFGQTKEARGFRRFSLRGEENVSGEWDIVSLTHNLLKLFRSGYRPKPA